MKLKLVDSIQITGLRLLSAKYNIFEVGIIYWRISDNRLLQKIHVII